MFPINKQALLNDIQQDQYQLLFQNGFDKSQATRGESLKES